jgi:hypothetical protein
VKEELFYRAEVRLHLSNLRVGGNKGDEIKMWKKPPWTRPCWDASKQGG